MTPEEITEAEAILSSSRGGPYDSPTPTPHELPFLNRDTFIAWIRSKNSSSTIYGMIGIDVPAQLARLSSNISLNPLRPERRGCHGIP